MNLVLESDSLHERVKVFAMATRGAEDFERLAMDIAEFQLKHEPGFRRLAGARFGSLTGLDELPAVPVEVFRWTRVAVHPPALDAAVFATSGTTGQSRGHHPMRKLDTYRALAVEHARRAFGTTLGSQVSVVALAPRPAVPNTSSLTAMMRFFM
jgi:hypothetical protein